MCMRGHWKVLERRLDGFGYTLTPFDTNVLVGIPGADEYKRTRIVGIARSVTALDA